MQGAMQAIRMALQKRFSNYACLCMSRFHLRSSPVPGNFGEALQAHPGSLGSLPAVSCRIVANALVFEISALFKFVPGNAGSIGCDTTFGDEASHTCFTVCTAHRAQLQ